MASNILLRRDTAANWSSFNPVLLSGEWAFVLDDRTYRIGDGVTAFNSLEVYYPTGEVRTINSASPVNGDIALTQDNVPDGITYVRVTTAEKVSYNAKLDDAPSDGTQYGRQNGAWVEITASPSSVEKNPFTATIEISNALQHSPIYTPAASSTLNITKGAASTFVGGTYQVVLNCNDNNFVFSPDDFEPGTENLTGVSGRIWFVFALNPSGLLGVSKYTGDDVTSVNGLTGVVTLTQDEVLEGATYQRITQVEKDSYASKLDDADSDGLTYGRQDGTWVEIQASSGAVATDNSLIGDGSVTPLGVNEYIQKPTISSSQTVRDGVYVNVNENTGGLRSNVNVVLMGSSTALGVGADAGYSFGELLNKALNSYCSNVTYTNIAAGGTQVRSLLPTGTYVETGVQPDPTANITRALELGADIVVAISPSNDITSGNRLKEDVLADWVTIAEYAEAHNMAFIHLGTNATNDLEDFIALRDLNTDIQVTLPATAKSIYEHTVAADGSLKVEYSADGTHMNNTGHMLLFNTMWSSIKDIIDKTSSGNYILERADSEDGNYSVVARSGNINTIADFSAEDNVPYWYRLRPEGHSSGEAYSHSGTYIKELLFNFCEGVASADLTYNSVLGQPPAIASLYPSFTTEGINYKSAVVTVGGDGFGWRNSSGTNGTITGDDSGVHPDDVMISYWYSDDTVEPNGAKVVLKNMEQGVLYNLEFFGSRAGATRTTEYVAGGQTVSLAVGDNTQNTVSISNVSADINGDIEIIVRAIDAASQFGYLNALRVTW